MTTPADWNTVNISKSWNSSNFEESGPEPDVPPYVVVTLIIIGTIGNVLVCLTIFLDKKLQNVTNFFLFSLAVTDLLINLIILPGRIAMHNYVFQPSSFPLCFLYIIGDNYLTAASALHICFISLERYLAIKQPLDMRNVTKRRMYVKLGLVWIISFLTIIPCLVLIIITDHPTTSSSCVTLLANLVVFVTILYIESLVIFIMVAVVIFSFLGTSIILYRMSKKQSANKRANSMGMIRTVGGNKSENGSKSGKNSSQTLNTESKALRVVWLVSFAFVIAMAPYAVVNMVFLIAPKLIIHPYILKLVAYLAYSNSVINPILYTIFNKKFRNNFKNILCFKYKKG